MSEAKAFTLRERVVKGGAYLVLRQSMSMVIGFGGMLCLTRMIGPSNYGMYATLIGVIAYLTSLVGLGLNVYLIRQESIVERKSYDLVFTLLLFSSVIVVVFAVIFTPFLGLWLHNSKLVHPFILLIATMPLLAITLPNIAKIERDLNYRAIAMVELFGQIMYYVIALSLAFFGYGLWSPVVGYCVQQLCLALVASYFTRYIPRYHWSWEKVKEIIKYGLGYSSSMWVWQLRTLVNPLIVGRFAGQETVGYIALAMRLIDVLSFIKSATWRVSIAALAKLQGDKARLKRALDEAIIIQLLSLGPFLIAFAIAGKWVIPLTIGGKWLPMLHVFPFIALSILINAIFSMHSSVLYVLKRNWDVTLFHSIHIILFAGGAFLLVPSFGMLGYGVAELFTFISYNIIHYRLTVHLTPSYHNVLPWVVAFSPALFAPLVSNIWEIALLIPLPFVFASPEIRKQVIMYMGYFSRGTA